MAMDPSEEAVKAAVKFLEGYGFHIFDDIVWGALKTAAAIDGDYNAGIEAAAKYLEDDYGYAVAAEIRKLKKETP